MRQAIGCGWEAPTDDGCGWVHQGMAPPRGVKLDEWRPTCPGYTTRLPEVIEASQLWSHWKRGALRDACGGQPRQAVLDACLIIEGESNAVESWLVTPKSKGGGRAD